MQFLARTPLAGIIRIGRPPGGATNHPSKLSYFEFCLPERNERNFYTRDEFFHQELGIEPTEFGPVFFVSDNPLISVSFSLDWWAGKSGKVKRRCYKLIDPLGGGVVDDGRPACRLTMTRSGEEYHDYECNSDQCKDFIEGLCNKTVKYRFFMPNAQRLGEYTMTIHSYHGLSSAFGLMNVFRKTLRYDKSRGLLLGLSKVPIYFRIEHGTTRFKGKDMRIWFPVAFTKDKGGAFFFLEELTKREMKKSIASGESTREAQMLLASVMEQEEGNIEEVPTEYTNTDLNIEPDQDNIEKNENPDENVSLTSGQFLKEDPPPPPPVAVNEEGILSLVPDAKSGGVSVGKLYYRVEKEGIIIIENKDLNIGDLPEHFNKIGEYDIYFKQSGDGAVDVDLALFDDELIKLFDNSKWSEKPNKLFAMLTVKNRDYTVNALRKQQK
jgi:hypothetical protein